MTWGSIVELQVQPHAVGGPNLQPPGLVDRNRLARIFHELLSRDHEDGLATWQPYRGIGLETYLNGTSQGAIPEDARKEGHIRDRSKLFMKYPGYGQEEKL